MDKTEIKNLVLALVIVALVVLFGYVGMFNPWGGVQVIQTDLATLQKEQTELKQRVSDAEKMVQNLDKVRKERETLEVQLKELSRKLPNERESDQVLRSVETLAGKSGLSVTNVKRRAVRPQELYAEIPMEVGVTGAYGDLLKFADQLAQLERLVTLLEVVVGRPPPLAPGAQPPVNGAAPTVQAQLVAVVFQAIPEPVPATPPKP